MDASQHWYPEIVHSGSNASVASFTNRMLAKCSEILPNIILNGYFATLVPRNSAFRFEHKFCIFYVSNVSEMLWNTPKHHFVSNGPEWMLHNFSTPKIVHSKPKDEFFIFYVPKVSEMLRNTPKHHFGTNGLEWMLHNFSTPKIVHSKPKDEFLIFYVPKVSEILRNTLNHHFGTNGLEWMLHNFGTPK
jgi:hypothetical protein